MTHAEILYLVFTHLDRSWLSEPYIVNDNHIEFSDGKETYVVEVHKK